MRNKMRKRVLFFLLVFMLLTSTAALAAPPVESRGAGERDVLALLKDPERVSRVPSGYKAIRTAADLRAVTEKMSGNYILMNDIDLGGISWETLCGKNYGDYHFTGVLEGNGYTIRNLKVDKDRYNAAGLIERNYGTIRNLRVAGLIDLTNDGSICEAGGIAVYNYGTIENCTSAVRFEADGSMPVWMGGIACENIGTIDYCRYTGTMNTAVWCGDVNQGGIAYINENEIAHSENTGIMIGTVNGDPDSYSSGNSGHFQMGGITYNSGFYKSKINQCRSKADIRISGSCRDGEIWVGGLTGYALAAEITDSCFNGSIRINLETRNPDNLSCYVGGIYSDGYNCTINNCYVSGSIVDSSPQPFYAPGWLFGRGGGAAPMVTGCYYPAGTFDPTAYYNLPKELYSPISLTSMASQKSFPEYNFNSVWSMGQSYPVQKVFQTYYYPDGSVGEMENTREISDEEYIAQHLAFAQSADYDLRMDNRFAELLKKGMDTTGANAGEAAYDILNTVSEITKFKELSIFDNPYDAILIELILNSTEANVASVEIELDIKLESLVNNVWGMVQKVQPDYKVSEYKPAIQSLLTKPEELRRSNPRLYKNILTALEQYLSKEGAENTLKALSGTTNFFGKLGDFVTVVNNAGSTVEWVTDTANYYALVQAYKSMSDEYIGTLREVSSQMSGSNRTRFRSALDKYDSWITENCIAAAVFKEGLYGFKELTLDVLSPLNSYLIISYMADALKIDAASISVPVAAYNFGWTLSDWITGNDKVVESRELIRANYYLEDALYKIHAADVKRFLSNRSLENARKFDASYMLLRNTEIYSLQAYKDYLEAHQESFAGGIMHLGNNDFNEGEMKLTNYEIVKWESVLCHGEELTSYF